MTVAVPERTAPTPPWRPPTDLLPLTATQPVSLCYHGNFSLSLVDNDSDVSDDVVDADSIRSILELAEQCALGISARDTAHQDMYPNELTPPPASCDEATTTYQPCRFTAGVKRKLDFDSVDDETLGDSLTSREEGGVGEERPSDYMDQQRMLEVSLCKMRRMEDPETSLRRCVLINNMTVKLKRELDHHDQHCRPMLPKKRHAFRRVDSISIQPDVVGLTSAHNPGCRYDSHRAGLRRTLEADAFEKSALSQCKESTDGFRDSLEIPVRYSKCAPVESDAADGDGDSRADHEAPSIFGDIDNVFQSLLSCLGEPM